jgi:hypothetical protein
VQIHDTVRVALERAHAAARAAVRQSHTRSVRSIAPVTSLQTPRRQLRSIIRRSQYTLFQGRVKASQGGGRVGGRTGCAGDAGREDGPVMALMKVEVEAEAQR